MTAPLDQPGQDSATLADRGSAVNASPGIAVAKFAQESGALLESLVQAGAHRYQPARFHYLCALVRRASSQQAPIADILAQRAAAALTAYQQAFSRARRETAVLVGELAMQFPQSAERLRQLLDSGDFRAVGRLATRLRRSATPGLLAGLTAQIADRQAVIAAEGSAGSLEAILRKQELQALNAAAAPGLTEHGRAHTRANPTRELNAVRHFRESLVKINADRLVRQAIEEVPEDSGPLNPQKLVVYTMVTMGQLSPAYLRRLVCYLDTLLWLDQADPGGRQASAKKPGTATPEMESR